MQDFPTIQVFGQGLGAVQEVIYADALNLMLQKPSLLIENAMKAAAGTFYIRFLRESAIEGSPTLTTDDERILLAHLETISGWRPATGKDEVAESTEASAPEKQPAISSEKEGVSLSVNKRGKQYVIRYAPSPLEAKPQRINAMRLANAASTDYIEPTQALFPFADRCWKAGLLDRHPETSRKFRINEAGMAWLEQFGN